MKHSMPSAPEALRRVVIAESGGPQTFLVVDDAAGTAALGQMGVLEIHGWNARAADIEHPDRLVFDLDPGDRVPWATVCDTARLVRAALEALDLESFVKTTGGNGLHVVVPLVPAADWDACLGFVRTLAGHLERADPRRLTTGFRKAGRADKILLDYVRNSRGSTSIAPYSMRARPSGGVSTPITWEELGTVERGDQFTLGTMGSRLASLRRDPWHGFLRHRQRLTPTRCRAVSDVRLR
jgi:bifunctional non-homologous end joining protein LigD